jgi:glycosyltransferase involved in cell wall biosynthesis
VNEGARAAQLAETIAAWTRANLEELVERHLPGFHVPRTFAGYAVGPDLRADLAYTLGLLDACGHGHVAGVPASESIPRVLKPIDGRATHTFFSYRVAETLARAAGATSDLATHPWLAGWNEAERANLAEACDSTSWCPLLDTGKLPANYAAVLARCEVARTRLGLPVDPVLLEQLVARTLALVSRNPAGWHDDSPRGAGRYDIYTADLYLFLQPLADDPRIAPRLAGLWRRGLRSVLELVERIGSRNGAAFCWGRSTGALAVCLTIELGAIAAARDLSRDPSLWLGRATDAFARFSSWLSDGLISAHQYRSTYSYRGPERRLQMTLDCLGKLAWSALQLRSAQTPAATAQRDDLFAPCDELVTFSPDAGSAVWAFRSRSLSFILPIVGSTLNDYLPAAQRPGFLEVPVEIDLPTGVPFAIRNGRRFAPAGRPSSIVHQPGRLRVVWERWSQTGEWESTEHTPALAGRRIAEIEVCDGTLRVRDVLQFDELPEALSLQIAESSSRRLRVDFACSSPSQTTVIATAGIKEYRSFWGELERVHQIDIEPARDVELRWSVAPVLRVASSSSKHHYNRLIYEPLAGRVEERQFPFEWLQEPQRTPDAFLDEIDLFHLHWPEWTSHDADAHRALIDRLREHQVRILWTQHNLVPHSRDPKLRELYDLWAEAADGVIHHSHWGEQRVRGVYAFRPDAIHRVIPHPHFGHPGAPSTTDAPERRSAQRADVERELGLRPCAIRLGVVGAPRPEKDVQLVLDAFAACGRQDLGLLVLSLAGDERVPVDARIASRAYEMVSREIYDRRLCAIDALVFPIKEGELLTTGVVGDAIGAGLPSLISDWPFLRETLGDAAIGHGSTRADLTACLERLRPDELERAAAAACRLRASCSSERVAELTLDLIDRVGAAKI